MSTERLKELNNKSEAEAQQAVDMLGKYVGFDAAKEIILRIVRSAIFGAQFTQLQEMCDKEPAEDESCEIDYNDEYSCGECDFFPEQSTFVPQNDYESMRRSAEEWRDKYIQARIEAAALQQWKTSALSTLPDWQEIGRVLELPVGTDVHKVLLDHIRRLKVDSDKLKRLIVNLNTY